MSYQEELGAGPVPIIYPSIEATGHLSSDNIFRLQTQSAIAIKNGMPWIEKNYRTLMLLVQKHCAVHVTSDPAFDPQLEFEGFLLNLGTQTNTDVLTPSLAIAPAGSCNHHYYPGGLVIHYLEMWNWFLQLRHLTPSHQESWPQHATVPQVSEESILRGIIAHDLHKIFDFRVNLKYTDSLPLSRENSPFKYARVKATDQASKYSLSLFAMSQFCRTYGMRDFNLGDVSAMDTSEGGWSKVMPDNQSIINKLLYLLDELSGNITGRVFMGTVEHRQVEWNNPSRGVPIGDNHLSWVIPAGEEIEDDEPDSPSER